MDPKVNELAEFVEFLLRCQKGLHSDTSCKLDYGRTQWALDLIEKVRGQIPEELRDLRE